MIVPTSKEEAGPVVVLGSHAHSLTRFRGALIRRLVSKGYRVIAAAPDVDPETAADLAEMGAETHSTPLSRGGFNPFPDLAYAVHLWRFFRRTRPQALIAYTAKPVVWGALAGSAAGVGKITALITGLGFAFSEGARFKRHIAHFVLSTLYGVVLPRCRRVVFQNPDDRDLFIRRKLIRPEAAGLTAGSGVELDLYSVSALPPKPTFLMMARLLKDKGVREYAEAAARLRLRYPDAAFRLAGWLDEGPDTITREQLDSYIENGLEYLGRLEDVRPALAGCSVYVLPSYYREGVPRSILEALSSGRAVITTDMPGCRETVIPGENGYLVPPRDADALAVAMERFIADPALAVRMGARSRALAEAVFDSDVVAAETMKLAGLE